MTENQISRLLAFRYRLGWISDPKVCYKTINGVLHYKETLLRGFTFKPSGCTLRALANSKEIIPKQ